MYKYIPYIILIVSFIVIFIKRILKRGSDSGPYNQFFMFMIFIIIYFHQELLTLIFQKKISIATLTQLKLLNMTL